MSQEVQDALKLMIVIGFITFIFPGGYFMWTGRIKNDNHSH
jgi:hypothetical protein